MNTHEKRRLDMLVRIRNFGANYRQLFPDTSSASAAFAVIAAEAPQLEALDLKERLASRSARAARKAESRRRLIDWLTRAKNTARALAGSIPPLAAHLDLPSPVDDHMLLTIARRFASAIAPHAEPFASKGIAIDELGRVIEPFESALTDRGSSRDEKTQARAEIALSMGRVQQALETLDLTVPNHLAADPVTLAAWKRDRRITRSTPRSGTEEPEVVPPAAAA